MDEGNKELLRIAYETQEVLVDASKTLNNQGKQLDNASRTLEHMHNDITVAERITGDIESWLGAWRVKGDFTNQYTQSTEVQNRPLGKETIEYPILYAKVAQESHQSGQAMFHSNKFEVLDEKSNIVHSFPLKQISDIDVHSPWDITITKRIIGNPSVRLHLTSARMPLLLKNIRKVCGMDLDLEKLPEKTREVATIEQLGACQTSGILYIYKKFIQIISF